MTYTKQQCLDTGITLGMPEDKSLYFYHHYNAQGWMYPGYLPITNLESAMWRWKNNRYKFDGKGKLFAIKGKICSKPSCGMPAVYKDTSGNYDNYKCQEHMPEKVKEIYK